MSYITGNTIRALREKNGITQKELAELIHVSDKTVSKWETNKGLPDVGILEELAKALRVSLPELFTGDFSPWARLRPWNPLSIWEPTAAASSEPTPPRPSRTRRFSPTWRSFFP